MVNGDLLAALAFSAGCVVGLAFPNLFGVFALSGRITDHERLH